MLVLVITSLISGILSRAFATATEPPSCSKHDDMARHLLITMMLGIITSMSGTQPSQPIPAMSVTRNAVSNLQSFQSDRATPLTTNPVFGLHSTKPFRATSVTINSVFCFSSSKQTHASHHNLGVLAFFWQPNHSEPRQSPQPRCFDHPSFNPNHSEPAQLPQPRYLAARLSEPLHFCRSPYSSSRCLAFQPTALFSVELFQSVTTISVLTFQPIDFDPFEPHQILQPWYPAFMLSAFLSKSSHGHHNLGAWLPAQSSSTI